MTKIISIDENVDKNGIVKSIAKDEEYYPGLIVKVISPAYYYEKKYEDEYSLKIIESKKLDVSNYFLERVIKTVEKYRQDFDNCEIITIIPTSKPNFPVSPTLNSIANHLSKHLDIPYEQIIKKIEFRISSRRKRKYRFNAVNGTIRIEGSSVEGKKVFLLDDLRTSGMSILEATKILKNAGATEVVCLCLGTHINKVPSIMEI